MREDETLGISELFFETCDYLKNKGVFMKTELKCLKCGCPMIIGKKLHAKYTCPACMKQYVIHGDGHLTVEGQI